MTEFCKAFEGKSPPLQGVSVQKTLESGRKDGSEGRAEREWRVKHKDSIKGLREH